VSVRRPEPQGQAVDVCAPDEVARFRRYLESAGGPHIPHREGLAAALRRPVPVGLRPYLRRWATQAVAPWARARAARDTAAPARLHLACGSNYKPGWVNVDLLGTHVDVPLDLSRGLPWLDGSVAAILHEHYLEHLNLRQAHALTTECHRVLRPGGVLRIGVPDARACLRAYCGEESEAQWIAGRPAPLLAVSELVYEHGHQSVWDARTLELLCRSAGFSAAAPQEFGTGLLQPNGDSENRRGWTLYVEAVRSP